MLGKKRINILDKIIKVREEIDNMIEKIIRMVSQFSEMNIESLISWFPQNEKSEIVEAINLSNDLTFIGDIVSLKKNIDINEIDLTKEAIIELVGKYNSKVEKEISLLTSNPEKIKLDTVINFLTKKYTLESYENDEGLQVFVQLEKDTLLNKGYAVIVSELSSQTYKKVESLFDTETVFIYYINNNECGECSTTKDFYVKSCEAILNEYMLIYNLKKEMIEINTIEIKSGGTINE